MRLIAPADFAAIIRDRRKRLKLNQSTLAKRIGVSRKSMIEMESIHPRVELGLALRALKELDIQLDASSDLTQRDAKIHAVDIDAIVARAKLEKP